MNVATPQAELYEKLLQIGWSLDSINFKNGVYIAKAKNEQTGQDIERNGKSPEMALAAVLRFATQAYNVRRMAGLRKFAAWDGSFIDKAEEIAQAYAKMDPFDQKAVPAWKALAAESKIQADAIKRQITVQVVDDPEPYYSLSEMANDVHQNRHYSVSRADTDHPVWTPEDVINFRTVSDVVAHCQSGAGFDWSGENKAFLVQAPLCSPLAREALFVETIGRAAYEKSFRGHGPTKIGFLSQFLHPVQEEQGEHVWVPHGGLPDQGALAQGIMDQAMSGDAGPNPQVPFASPTFERPPAVMEGYQIKGQPKTKRVTRKIKALFGWGDLEPVNIPNKPDIEIETPEWVPEEDDPLVIPEEWPEEAPAPEPEREKEPAYGAVQAPGDDAYAQPMPCNIPNNPDIEIETPEYVPDQDDPMTLPEEWPETAPAPERELEPALAHVHYSDDQSESGLKSAYAEEMYGWKILNVGPDGSLHSPQHNSHEPWPVGKPLEATWDDGNAIRNTKGIHLTDENGWSELYGYIKNPSAVLVKCRVWNYKGRKILYDSHAGTMRAPLAKPVLAVGTNPEILLRVANKYGIDTETAGSGERNMNVIWEQDSAWEEGSWKLVQFYSGGGQWQGFQFDRSRAQDNTYFVLDENDNERAWVEGDIRMDYNDQPEDAEIESISASDSDAEEFLKDFFGYMSEPSWSKEKSSEWGEYDYEMADWRDYETVSDVDDLLQESQRLDYFTYDGYQYEWDDSDVQWNLSDNTDEYGLHWWTATVYEPAPPELRFDPEDWHNIFIEEVQMLEQEWSASTAQLQEIAKALVEVPKFIIEEQAQQGTSSQEEWVSNGGMNFIRSQIDMVRPWEQAQEQQDPNNLPPLETFLQEIERNLGGEPIPGQGVLYKENQPRYEYSPYKVIQPDEPITTWKDLDVPGTFSKKAGRDPDYLFVYYKSELRMKKWEHSLRQSDMLEELLDEFDVDMGNSGLDIDPAEVAAGEIYAYPDGEYRVEHKQLSNPDVREYAEDLIQDWLWDWRSLDQARDPSSGQFV